MNPQHHLPSDLPAFDFDTLQRFLDVVKGDSPYCWQIIPDKNGKGRATLFHGTLEEVKDKLIQAQRNGCGIFITVNRTDGKGRRKTNVLKATAVFVDADGIPLPEQWPIPPHVIVQRSSDRWHAYWLIQPTDDLAAWTMTQKRLANFLKTDPSISDPPRVMRVPGFFHLKGEPLLVKLIQCPTADDVRNGKVQRFTLEELETAYPGEVKLSTKASKEPSTVDTDQTPLVEWDLKVNIEHAIAYLRHEAPMAIEHQHGDDQTVQVAAHLKDIGISQDKSFELMKEHWNPHCRPPWSDEELKEKVANAFTYMHNNQPGCESPLVNKKAGRARRVREALDAWVWAVDAKCFVRRHDCQMWDRDQFDSVYGHLADKYLLSNQIFKQESSIRRFERLTYLPGQPEFPDDGSYNIWRPSGVEPKEGEVDWFLTHMEYLIPDDHERNLVLDYLAFLVKHPGQKIHFALVVQGLPGTGKSFIGQLMERIIGEQNTSRPSNEELHSEWTTWQRQAQLVVVEELMTIGRQELINKLKSVITDETIRIHEKYRNTYSLNNCLNFLMLTNYKDALKVEMHDRRFFVVFSPAQPREESYYAALFSNLKKDGPAHVAHRLSQRDLSDFKPKGVAPQTAAKREMRRANLDEVHQVLLDLLDNGQPPFGCDLVSMADLEQALPERLRRVRNLNGKLTGFLRDQLGATKRSQVPVDNGRRKCNVWIWRNQNDWASKTSTVIGRQYDAQVKGQDIGLDEWDPILG
ncbi:primase-helicase family protein [Candidatus Nitronereus thalassa]|uniref:DUF5906 domain-containing protein n=1 Tax=Candidatus Nitronereus thalassa TaxID=3020898 RepID=A0ABU3KE25_9BACT|nr:DUF5906 domain-containing protein [Candidatus Nitronereus thalassa]MDT7044307.1 DUF5906 domain-containing protein [Candidatus Nitronereus thalassa]